MEWSALWINTVAGPPKYKWHFTRKQHDQHFVTNKLWKQDIGLMTSSCYWKACTARDTRAKELHVNSLQSAGSFMEREILPITFSLDGISWIALNGEKSKSLNLIRILNNSLRLELCVPEQHAQVYGCVNQGAFLVNCTNLVMRFSIPSLFALLNTSQEILSIHWSLLSTSLASLAVLDENDLAHPFEWNGTRLRPKVEEPTTAEDPTTAKNKRRTIPTKNIMGSTIGERTIFVNPSAFFIATPVA